MPKISSIEELKKSHPKLDFSLIGRRFGKLRVSSFAYYDTDTGHPYWTCICDCGKTKTFKRSRLFGVKSCGCFTDYVAKGEKAKHFNNLATKRFGKIKVISLNSFTKNGTKWNCVCDCGNERVVFSTNLTRGKTRGCGECNDRHKEKKIFLKEGQKFGSYTLLRKVKKIDNHSQQLLTKWMCRCDCGYEIAMKPHILVHLSKDNLCPKCRSSKWSKDKHHNWNPNLTDQDRKERFYRANSLEYKKWRYAVYKRDNWLCQVTGKQGRICAHHLNGYSQFPDQRLLVSNGITVLQSIHLTFHKRFGPTTTREDFTEFVNSLTIEELQQYT